MKNLKKLSREQLKIFNDGDENGKFYGGDLLPLSWM